jgi:hypothetical protein
VKWYEGHKNRSHHTAEPDDQRRQRAHPDREHPNIIISGLQNGPTAGLEQIADRVVEAVARDEAIDATALTFLLRRYRQTDTDTLRRALNRRWRPGGWRGATTCSKAPRGSPLHRGGGDSADERLREAIADLVPPLRHDWTCCRIVGDRALTIDACLNVIDVFDPRDLAPKAIDALEHLVAAAYRPGEGLVHDLDSPHGARGHLADHLGAAGALLSAYVLTWRLPYGMLAEELVQFARRALWDDQDASFRESPDAVTASRPFALNCDAVRVLCRLAALHHDDDYRHVAVVAADANYKADASSFCRRTPRSRTIAASPTPPPTGSRSLNTPTCTRIRNPIWPQIARH